MEAAPQLQTAAEDGAVVVVLQERFLQGDVLAHHREFLAQLEAHVGPAKRNG